MYGSAAARDDHMRIIPFVIVAFPICSIARTAGAAETYADRPAFHIQGRGEVTATADMAAIDAAVVTEAPTAAEATERNRQIVARVLTALATAQIPKDAIETISIEVTPVRPFDPQTGLPGKIERFTVTNRMRVEVRNIDRAGMILDRMVAAGANSIFGLTFSVRQPERLIEEAQRRAVRNAMSQAQIFAKAAGVKLGPAIALREISEPLPRPFAMEAAVFKDAATPIIPGEQRFVVLIEMSFAIGERSAAELAEERSKPRSP
jgi:hypothetical protein